MKTVCNTASNSTKKYTFLYFFSIAKFFFKKQTKLRLIFSVCSLTLGFQLFTINSCAQYTKLHDFGVSPDGGSPLGSLVSDGTFLYGMTRFGGLNNKGTVFKIKTDGTGYTKLLDFDGFTGTANGSGPLGSLIFDGTFLYGMTIVAGTLGGGTIFKIKPDGTGFTKLLDFDDVTTGKLPNGSLFFDGQFLYGTTSAGGVANCGVVFKIKPDGTGYVKIQDFAFLVTGCQPYGFLISDGTFLYGTTSAGGPSGAQGTCFKIRPDGTGYTQLLTFNGANGRDPGDGFVSDGTFLYGITRLGGTTDDGTIFKIKPDGTGYAKLLDFEAAVSGENPYGSLITDGTFVYGMTGNGGTNSLGTIFKIKSDGTGYTKLLDFAGTSNGSIPGGSVTFDGTFLYGMTSSGGANGLGTIFKYALAPPVLPTITSFTPPSGPIGTTVTITGTNFSATPADNTVRFNGTLATVTASSATSITTTVPIGSSTGMITVAVAGNTATSGSSFTVTVLSITNFVPASGSIGTTVVITGTNFSTTPADNSVRFNGTVATVTASTATSITTTVPAAASTGPITVTVSGNTATSASNFTVTAPSITVTTQPTSVNACAGAMATFTTAASGTTNITYQWQFAAASTGPYNNIMNGSEYSNVTASTLSVNTTGNFGAGNYRCKISGDFVTDKYSNAVTFTVNELPVTPSITSEAACGPASFSITASGAINGQYRWYTTAVGGTSITGQTNSSYTTPVINSSEAYYVAIYNGICESARNGVVAQVNMVPAAPTVVSTTACSPSSVTLQASEGGESQYRWYTQALGGPFISGETGSSYVTPSLSTPTTYYVTIVYLTCESARTAILADVRLCSANLPPSIIPASTVTQIDEKVTLNLAVLISDPDNNLDLSTLKIITQPESKASASIDANHNLIIDYKGIAFTGRDRLKIEACDLANSCTQQEIIVDVEGDILVYNAISPNGDGKNDTWVIKNIDLLKDTRSNHVIIFNRWGDSVFEVDNYDNANRKFTGLNKNGIELPTGTYFYKMEFASGRKSQTGFISLKR